MSLYGTYNFAVQRGAAFSRTFRRNTKNPDTGVLTPVDLTGYKARAQIRTLDGRYGTTTTTTLLVDLTDGSGIAVSNAANGEVTITLTEANLETMCPTNERTVLAYGIELYDDVTSLPTLPLLQGKITVLPETPR